MDEFNDQGEEKLLQGDNDAVLDMNDSSLDDDWLSREVALLGIATGGELNTPQKSSSAMDTTTVDELSTNTAEMQPKNIDLHNNNIVAVTTTQNSTNNFFNPAVNCANCVNTGPNNEQQIEGSPSKRLDWISAKTKRLINTAMGKHHDHICQICNHQATSLRRHREHARSHFLWFICPCGYVSQSKEVTRRHQIQEERMEEPADLCIKNILYTIDDESFDDWQKSTGTRLACLPKRKITTRPSATSRLGKPTESTDPNKAGESSKSTRRPRVRAPTPPCR